MMESRSRLPEYQIGSKATKFPVALPTGIQVHKHFLLIAETHRIAAGKQQNSGWKGLVKGDSARIIRHL